ncbi:MAG TPA: addiction module protein [Pyrinomonadaceae bacterium]|nr:addiction module protein [Pyrinomonadaceae bacterium]
MSVVAEAEKLVFSLSEKDRAELVGKILRSLPLYAEDGGLFEARRRDREMDENPDSVITMDQLDEMISGHFPFVRK